MKKILALDPGSTTGYCLAEVDNDVCNIVKIGFIIIDKDSEYEGYWCLDLMSKVNNLYLQEKFDEVCVEDFFFSRRFCNGANLNVALRTSIHIWCCQKKIPYSILNIWSWKKFILKNQVKKKVKGKKVDKKEEVILALKNDWNLDLPEYSISSTGRQIKFKHDISDAIAQLMYFVDQKYNIKIFKIKI
jgi:Holliday junction resolvasome RuvABC endonuclease subunit